MQALFRMAIICHWLQFILYKKQLQQKLPIVHSTVIPLKTLYAHSLETFAKDALYFALDVVLLIRQYQNVHF